MVLMVYNGTAAIAPGARRSFYSQPGLMVFCARMSGSRLAFLTHNRNPQCFQKIQVRYTRGALLCCVAFINSIPLKCHFSGSGFS